MAFISEDTLDRLGFSQEGGIFSERVDGIRGDSTGRIPLRRRAIEFGQGNTRAQTYQAMVLAIDDVVEDILKALAIKGELEETLIVFLSDNGGDTEQGASNFPLRGGKGSSYEGGLRVPAILYWPERITQKSQCDHVVSCQDIGSELIQLIGSNGETSPNSPFCQALGLNEIETTSTKPIFIDVTTIIDGKWKLTNDELFDIEADPSEIKNVKETHPEVFQRLKELLK